MYGNWLFTSSDEVDPRRAIGGELMGMSKGTRRWVSVLRWAARLWSLAVLVLALIIALSPDPNATGESVPLGDIIVLSFWGIAVIGLLVAWRYEGLGAIIAIAGAVANYIGFRVVHGSWPPGPNFIVIPGILLVLPAVLFLLARHYDRTLNGSIGA